MESALPPAVRAALTAGPPAGREYSEFPGTQGSEPFVDENRGAKHLGVSPRTMQRWRMTGTGPRWFRIGRLAKYRIPDLTAWAEAQARTSTSDKVPNAWLEAGRGTTVLDVRRTDRRYTRRSTKEPSETRS
jgi:hypothetical protein